MSVVLPYLLSGISVGGQYALIAIGYTMVYGILRLINFAHGDVFMVAGVMMVYLSSSLPLYISMPLMLILTVIIGFAIERAAYKPLRSAPRMSIMISAIGVSYLAPESGGLYHRRSGTAVSHRSFYFRFREHRSRHYQGGSAGNAVSGDCAGVCSGDAHQPHQDRHGNAGGFQGL